MGTSGATTSSAEDSAPRQAEYSSALFGKFTAKMERLESGVPILDLGPSTTRNVMFWIGRGHPVSALDLGSRRPDGPVDLEYPDSSFGGVICWTALSHLSAERARELVQEIGRVLRPDGWLFAVFDGDGRKQPEAQRYTIVEPDVLLYEPMEQRPGPRSVLTSEVESLLRPFREVRVMVMRHGSREALARRP